MKPDFGHKLTHSVLKLKINIFSWTSKMTHPKILHWSNLKFYCMKPDFGHKLTQSVLKLKIIEDKYLFLVIALWRGSLDLD
jgi:hypothetical protein